MSTDNVVYITDFKGEAECEHRHVTLYEEDRVILCKGCGRPVDPFGVALIFAKRLQRLEAPEEDI